MKRIIHVVAATLTALSGLAMVGSFIWMIWASALAEAGHRSDALQTPAAATYTSIICWVMFGALWVFTDD